MKSTMGLFWPALWFLGMVTILSMTTAPAEGVVDDLTIGCCSCTGMMPLRRKGSPQSMPPPFEIRLQRDVNVYSVDSPLVVTLKSKTGATFRSFMLAAYKHRKTGESGDQVARGKFEPLNHPAGYKVKYSCFGDETFGSKSNAVLSQSNTPVTELKFKWTPLSNYGPIELRATFIFNDTMYWVGELYKDIIYDKVSGVIPKKTDYIPPINTQECGKSKGCYRVPEDCIDPECFYILTWKSNYPYIDFELGGLTEGHSNSYVAAALSDDTYVGDDDVLVCASTANSTGIYFGKHNDEYETKILSKYHVQKDKTILEYGFLEKDVGSNLNDRVQCRFTVHSKNLDTSKFRFGGKHHIIMSNGLADEGKPFPMGVGYDNFPRASADKVVFTSYSDSSGQASYPLVKAHGCLMILAWILFSSVGFLLAKYYQPMWPDKRVYDRKYWFAGHFKAMTMVFILVVIAVILIFIEADGYTYARDLPYRAHPILGIIIFVCVLILPFIALLRPGKGHDCRNVFNWLYWIFATIANVLAVPNIFIGMNFGKASVPWWATWILVFWVIFHIIVEIILEIHQCATHKKNKEKRKKHELLKRDYPKQHHPVPEPAGRRFKRFMLLLHLAITILIVLIMIIVIAVS